MKCKLCGHELNADETSCPECGHDQSVNMTTGVPQTLGEES